MNSLIKSLFDVVFSETCRFAPSLLSRWEKGRGLRAQHAHLSHWRGDPIQLCQSVSWYQLGQLGIGTEREKKVRMEKGQKKKRALRTLTFYQIENEKVKGVDF